MAVSFVPLDEEKMKKFTSMFSDNEQLGKFGDIGCVLRSSYVDTAQEVKGMDVREDDVWVVTPPKCGTTWTQEMVWLLVNDLDFERAKKDNLLMRFPFLELSRLMPDIIVEQFLKGLDTLEYTVNLPSPRCIKSHLPKELLPDQLWTKKPKIIYVARDPKDAAVSFFYHEKLFQTYKGEKDFFFECYYEDLAGYCPVWEHILDFWKMRDEPNILFNTFEEMKADLPAVIRRTAKFLGKTITEEQVARLAEHLDFKQMKSNPSVNIEDELSKMRAKGVINKDQAFIRKGVVGEGSREMSREMAALYDERSRRVFTDAVGGCPWTKWKADK